MKLTRKLKNLLKKRKYFYTEINNQRFSLDLTALKLEDYTEEELVDLIKNGYIHKDKVDLTVANTKIYYARKIRNKHVKKAI